MSTIGAPIAAPTNDAAPQAISEQPQTTKPDPKLDVAAKYERQLQKMRRELQEAQRSIEQYKTGYVDKNRLKSDPMGALKDVDLDYDKLTELSIASNDPVIRTLQARLQEMERKDLERESRAQLAEQAQLEQTRKQILNDVKLTTNGREEFDLIEKWGAHESVADLIEETFEKEGYILDASEAAKQVEERLLGEALKILESPKIKSRPQQATTPAGSEQAPTAAPVENRKWKNPEGPYSIKDSPRNINTLTNRLAQETTTPASAAQDRRARAIAILKGELK